MKPNMKETDNNDNDDGGSAKEDDDVDGNERNH